MNAFDQELSSRLGQLREQGLYRQLRRVDSPQTRELILAGRTVLNFSSNDYLGLANDPLLKEAALQAVAGFGSGSGASRLICGSLAPHHQLEEALAAFKGTEAALVFSTGYATALGTIAALVGREDVIVLDKLVHASIVDGARLSGAKIRVFAHNDLDDLERILRWADQRHRSNTGSSPRPQTLIVTESAFSMDGDHAPLREIAELKDRFGAWLMVDEAHATGIYGPLRRGLAEESGVADRIEVQMGTLGKALGASGGYICGSRPLIDFLINRSRSFIFSTAPVPAAAAAAAAALHFVQSQAGEQRCRQLWDRVGELQTPCPPTNAPQRSAIVPIILGEEAKAMQTAAKLLEKGFYIPAIRYPTVARGQARLRITVTASHTKADISALNIALQDLQQ